MRLELDGETVRYTTRTSSKAQKPNIRSKKTYFEVVIPEKSALKAENLLKRKKNWVLRIRKDHEKYREKIPKRLFMEGENWRVLGEQKEIRIESRKTGKVDDDILLAEHLVERTSVKYRLKQVLKDEARNIFEYKSDLYTDRIAEDYEKIFVRDQTTRWGSCSRKKNLNFNWRLVLGPQRVVDYVVAHEVAHLVHMNHGEEFWVLVEELHPDHRSSKDWLEQNAAELTFDPESLRLLNR
ncbi:MAG: M48 family metallopeptidase [Nanohaloarchaea archaeon]|nr:M48 family metallopeptidase [Candidatus Nanohaloarchaea archaeon]